MWRHSGNTISSSSYPCAATGGHFCMGPYSNNNNNKINSNKSKLKITLSKEYTKYINIFNQKKIFKFLEYKPKINHKIKFLPKKNTI